MVAEEHVHFLHEVYLSLRSCHSGLSFTCLNYHFQAIPFADKFIFEDGKHNLHLKYKDQFNALVSDFLAK